MDAGDWSDADAHGLQVRLLDCGARSTLKARRQRRSGAPPQTAALTSWPADWRQLLADWLRPDVSERRWTALLRSAGNARVPVADALCEALLELGWIRVDEQRDSRGIWRITAIGWRDADGLRAALGLPRRDSLQAARAAALVSAPNDPRLLPLHTELAGMPHAQAIARAALLQRLDAWIDARRDGTRRDFALFARGDSKGVAEAEWRWLEVSLALDELGISRHLPVLWLRAPLTICLPDGELQLGAVPDAIALTPATVAAVLSVEGTIGHWRIVENRTSFERAARQHGERDGVLWAPGFVPGWWRLAAGHLMQQCPAPALVACDPDPAGIEIALGIAAVCAAAGIAWQPWSMAASDLAALPAHKPLGTRDRERLDMLAALPAAQRFADLIAAMQVLGVKGEQEGLGLD